MLIGYARCSTFKQDIDLTAQRRQLADLGVTPTHIHTDVGLTGTNRRRPGLEAALGSLREGDTLVVTKLDRLGRSIRDVGDIAAEIETKGANLSIGGSIHNPHDPMGRLIFGFLSLLAEFEADLIRTRTKEGMAVAKSKGRLRGRKPKLTASQERHLVALINSGDYTQSEVAELMGVSRATIHRALQRANKQTTTSP